jgi:hypothetical protein
MRRAAEKKYYLELTIPDLGINAIHKLDYSCKNVYRTVEITINGIKKDIRVLKALVK